MARCLNCDHPVTDSYCPKCGQKRSVSRYSAKTFLQDVKETVLHLDSSFLRTFIALMKRPGHFIREYLFGKRARFISPFKYLFIVVALNVAFSFILDRPAINPVSIEMEGQGFSNQLISLLTSLVFILVMIPFGVGMRVATWKSGYCFMEHFSFLLYILSQSVLLFILLQLFLNASAAALNGPVEGAVWFVIFTALFIRSYPAYSSETGKTKYRSILLAYLIALTVIAILMFIIGAVVNRIYPQ